METKTNILRLKANKEVLERLRDSSVIREIRRAVGNDFSIVLPDDLFATGDGRGVITGSERYDLSGTEIAVVGTPSATKRALAGIVQAANSLEWTRKLLSELSVGVLLE